MICDYLKATHAISCIRAMRIFEMRQTSQRVLLFYCKHCHTMHSADQACPEETWLCDAIDRHRVRVPVTNVEAEP
jgi:hypothetical protein